MNREALQKGLSKVAWAYIFLLLDIDFSIGRCTLDFLPNWAGYLILLSSIPLLTSFSFSRLIISPYGTRI